MIGIGIDLVEIHRFSQWHTYSEEQLLKNFSKEEIAYCLSTKTKSAERFAVRFAAKEALYKALSSLFKRAIPFSKFCTYVSITKSTKNIPSFIIDWASLPFDYSYKVHISLSHCTTIACAVVVIE